MKAQAGKTGKGSAGQKQRYALKVVTKAEKTRADNKRKAAVQTISQRKPGQRAGMAANRAKAKKK